MLRKTNLIVYKLCDNAETFCESHCAQMVHKSIEHATLPKAVFDCLTVSSNWWQKVARVL